MKSYVVAGLGRFGSQLAVKLFSYGEDVLAIDLHENLIDKIADRVTRAVVADARDPDVLRRLDVQSCDCAIVAVGSDLASASLITMNLKSLGVPRVICKAYDDTYRRILEKLGADRVIIPENEAADKLAKGLSSYGVMEYIEFSEEYGIVEMDAPAAWQGRLIGDIGVHRNFGVSIIALKQNNGIEVSPNGTSRIAPGATLVLLGKYDALHEIEKL